MFPNNQKNIVAITGTNGKTSIAFYLKSIWKAANIRSASIGTLGVIYENKKVPINLTTPDQLPYINTLMILKKRCKKYCFEASSHGIEQNRLDALRINSSFF